MKWPKKIERERERGKKNKGIFLSSRPNIIFKSEDKLQIFFVWSKSCDVERDNLITWKKKEKIPKNWKPPKERKKRRANLSQFDQKFSLILFSHDARPLDPVYPLGISPLSLYRPPFFSSISLLFSVTFWNGNRLAKGVLWSWIFYCPKFGLFSVSAIFSLPPNETLTWSPAFRSATNYDELFSLCYFYPLHK